MKELMLNIVMGVIKGVTYVYGAVTYIPCCIIMQPGQKLKKWSRMKAVDVGGEASGVYRAVETPEHLTTTPVAGCTTLDDLFYRAVQKHGPAPCLGMRQLVSEEDEVQPNGKVFKKATYGEYQWESFTEVNERVDHVGRGLMSLGQKPRTSILLFSETRAEWMIMAQACFRFNFSVVTLYSTLGEDAIIHGVNESEVSIVVTSATLLPKFKSILPQMPRVRTIVYFEDAGAGGKVVPSAGGGKDPPSVTVLTLSQLEALASNDSGVLEKPSPSDMAVVMYTSGSTGLPKGVLITHANLMCGMSGQCQRITGLCPHDTYIGYLPLAHVLEMSAEISCMAYGTRIGYSSPQTITDQSSKIKRGTKGDASVLRPTLMAAVPLVLDRIYKAVWDKVNEGGPFARKLFTFAYNYKCSQLQKGFDTPIFNKLVFARPRALLGGRVRFMLSGSAPLNEDTQRFMNVVFCCPVGQGYGLTETCGAGTIQEMTDLSTGRVGAPLECNEFRLRDWEEGGYRTTDKPYPRGEVLVGGGNVAMGYFKNPAKTREDFVNIGSQRYFCTGDIGTFHPDGTLRIIDRRKDLVKLQAGEYVSLGKVETALKMCPLVDQICVYADSNKMYTVCLAVPNPKHLKALAVKLGIEVGEDWQELCSNPNLEKAALDMLLDFASKGQLERFEIPQRLTLCREPWTPEQGLVTDAFKLKRRNIQSHYQTEINRMYA